MRLNKGKTLFESFQENLKESTDNKEWKKVCEEFCKKLGAELLFINDDNFGYEDKNGNLIHMYADELAEYLKSMGEDLKEAYVEKKDNVDIEELAREIMSLIELYDEDKMNSGDDVFAGTEDAYAEEVFEQNLYSALLYSGLFHIESLQQEIEHPTEDGSRLDSLYNGIIQIVEYGDAFKGKTENLVNYLNSVLKESIKEAVDEHKYTLSNCIKQIKAIDDPKDFYNKVREIVGYNDEEWNNYYGWEDHEIKRLQREADARYEELKGTLDESVDTDIKAEKEKMLHVGRQKAVLKALKNAKEHLAKDDDYYLKKDSTARFNYENLVSAIDDTISQVEKFQKDIDKLEESFQVNGTAYVTLWDGDTGTIEMKPYNIEEITPEAICQGANDNGFGVKEITGVKAFIDGENYEFFEDEFKKYSEGKEKKGIQIPKADLGEIKDIEYYCLYTSRENYPVIKVNDKYLITRAGTNDFSGQWRLEGFLPFRMYSYRNLIKPDVALGIKDWLLKNGNSKYKVVDYDHGSTRIWSGSPRYLLTGFTPADKDFFKRLIGGKDSVIIEGKEYKLNDNLEEAAESENKVIRYNIFCDETPIEQDINSEEEAKKLAKDKEATVITKYIWSSDKDYNDNKEADKVEDIYLKNNKLKESVFNYEVGARVFWVGAGNEISEEGTIIDIPIEGRMTIKWDDGDVNTYSINNPNIQLADTYDNSFNESNSNDKAENTKLTESSYENETDKEKRLKNVFLMDRVIRAMNDEDALYNSGWLMNGVADGETDDGFEEFKNNAEKVNEKDDWYYTDDEDYKYIVDMYKDILNTYAKEGIMTRSWFENNYGNWKANAGLNDEELEFLKQDIQNLELLESCKVVKSWNKLLKESYAIVNYYDDEGYPKEKICNGNTPKAVESRVKRIADRYEIVGINQASADVADSEYLNSLGNGVRRKDYINNIFESLTEEDEKAISIDYIIDDYEYSPGIEYEDEFYKNGDSSYFKVVKTEDEAQKFNYHSDYWGSADKYQEDNSDLVARLEYYIENGSVVCIDDEGEESDFIITGIAIDKQYNSISHTKILIKDVESDK